MDTQTAGPHAEGDGTQAKRGGAIEFSDSDLPMLFHQTDRAAKHAQSTYIGLSALNLTSLVVTAATFLYDFPTEEERKFFAFARGVLLVLSLALTWMLDSNKPDRAWHQARYCAEEVKSLAWRYMTRTLPVPANAAVPADSDSADSDAADSGAKPDDPAFLAALQALDLPSELPPADFKEANEPLEITQKMRLVARSPLQVRHEAYRKSRLEDQQQWYRKRHQMSLYRERLCYNSIFAGQILAILLAFLKAAHMSWPWDLSGFLATLTAAFLAWIQMRQYQRLARAYDAAARDLRYLESENPAISTEADLIKFVDRGEQIIGAEYKEWRRRQEEA